MRKLDDIFFIKSSSMELLCFRNFTNISYLDSLEFENNCVKTLNKAYRLFSQSIKLYKTVEPIIYFYSVQFDAFIEVDEETDFINENLKIDLKKFKITNNNTGKDVKIFDIKSKEFLERFFKPYLNLKHNYCLNWIENNDEDAFPF